MGHYFVNVDKRSVDDILIWHLVVIVLLSDSSFTGLSNHSSSLVVYLVGQVIHVLSILCVGVLALGVIAMRNAALVNPSGPQLRETSRIVLILSSELVNLGALACLPVFVECLVTDRRQAKRFLTDASL